MCRKSPGLLSDMDRIRVADMMGTQVLLCAWMIVSKLKGCSPPKQICYRGKQPSTELIFSLEMSMSSVVL